MTTIEQAKQFLDECGFYFLATCEGDQPCVRPFGAHAIFEGKLYFQTGKRKAVAAQLAANPKAEICASKPDAWIRIRGKLIEDPRLEAQQAVLDANPFLKTMYAAGDGNTAVYYVEDGTVGFFSMAAGAHIEPL